MPANFNLDPPTLHLNLQPPTLPWNFNLNPSTLPENLNLDPPRQLSAEDQPFDLR